MRPDPSLGTLPAWTREPAPPATPDLPRSCWRRGRSWSSSPSMIWGDPWLLVCVAWLAAATAAWSSGPGSRRATRRVRPRSPSPERQPHPARADRPMNLDPTPLAAVRRAPACWRGAGPSRARPGRWSRGGSGRHRPDAVKQVQQGLQQIQALRDQLSQFRRACCRAWEQTSPGRCAAIAGRRHRRFCARPRAWATTPPTSRATSPALYPTDLVGLDRRQGPGQTAWRAGARTAARPCSTRWQVQNQIVQAQPAPRPRRSARAVSASQGAAGQTAADPGDQSTADAALSSQLSQLQTLLITQARQAQTWEAERRALDVKAEADRQAAVGPSRRVDPPHSREFSHENERLIGFGGRHHWLERLWSLPRGR
jgi:hypothetical protein